MSQLAGGNSPLLVRCYLAVIRVSWKCRSWLEGTGVYCYARVMRQTCSQSATDVTMLMTILYSAKWTRVVNEWCTHGKSPRIGDFYELLKQYSIVRNFTTCDHH